MAWRRSTPDFITGISPCAASAWGDGRLPAPCARDTAGDPRITSHLADWQMRLARTVRRWSATNPASHAVRGWTSRCRIAYWSGCPPGQTAPWGVDAGILRVVEGVVSFPAELEVALVTLHVEPLGKRHVPVVDARIADIIRSGIA